VTIVFVLLAGALGAVLRYLVSLVGGVWAVLLVNVVGSFIAGMAIALSGDLQLIVATGFCGGLTTFSTFSVHTVELAMKGKWNAALSAVVANIVLGFIAAAFGAGLVGF
jgi:fluoride exporter